MPNVGFTAKDNQDTIFIEKSDIYQNAQKDNDIELLKTFVEKNGLKVIKRRKL